MTIRRATEQDIPQLLDLMKGLARFEKYSDVFGVTENHLLEQGFRKSPPDFYAIVAHEDSVPHLLGMLVYYFVPFTVRGRPTLYIKELFVTDAARNRGIGALLMKAVARDAVAHGCALMKWQVADWNKESMRFYERLGSKANPVWVDYEMSEEAMKKLLE